MSVIQIKDLQIGDIYMFQSIDNSANNCKRCKSKLKELISRYNDTSTQSKCYFCYYPISLFYDDHRVHLIKTILI